MTRTTSAIETINFQLKDQNFAVNHPKKEVNSCLY